MPPTLSSYQKNAIHSHLQGFKKYLEGEAAKEVIDEIAERTALFKKLLTEDAIVNLTEKEFSEVIQNLWAINFWKKREYKISQLITENGIDNLRGNLVGLLHMPAPIESRYDQFRKSIKGMGPAMITEILITMFPDRYCLWNNKPMKVLPYLGMDNLLPESVFKGQVNGPDYAKCIEVMKLVRDELKQGGIYGVGQEVIPGFWTTDLFMWYLWGEKGDEIKATGGAKARLAVTEHPKPSLVIETHEEAQAVLLLLGKLSGYDTYTADPGSDTGKKFYEWVVDDSGDTVDIEKTLGELATLGQIHEFGPEKILDSARRIDVIWFKEELPEACFEVEHSTNVKDGLLREYQISKHAAAARFFVVAHPDTRPKFEKEVATYPFSQIRKRYTFLGYDDLVGFYQEARRYHRMKRELGLP